MIKENIRAFGGPSRYLQGPGVLDRLPEFTQIFGSSIYFVIDEFFYEEYMEKLKAAYPGQTLAFERFEGQITQEKVDAAVGRIKEGGYDLAVGIGGGKALDLAKDAADYARIPLIVAPTIASSDAPCSSVSILYYEDGREKGGRFHQANPNLVLVDTKVLLNAPVRFFAAGIGDALATYYEARANIETNSPNYIFSQYGGAYRRTILAAAVAEKCLSVIMADGEKAVNAVKTKALNEAFENVVEVNTLLSGIGFENNACAGAHAIGTGLGKVKSKTGMMHGEKVAYGILVQLHIENRAKEEMIELMDFFTRIGLPLTLEELGVAEDDETLKTIAEASFPCDWGAEPCVVNPEIVVDGMKLANFAGKEFRKNGRI